MPKRKLEKEYAKNKIPEVYSALVERTNQRLNQNAKNIEKIAFFTNFKIKDIIGVLNILEIKGIVKDLGNGMYSL